MNCFSITLAPLPLIISPSENLERICAVLAELPPEEVVVFPEAALSGYSEDPNFIDALDPGEINAAQVELHRFAKARGHHLVYGSCVVREGQWYNAGFYAGPNGELFEYRKVNLAISERSRFAAGTSLSTFNLTVRGVQVTAAFQLCREIRFPEQWGRLARQGVDLFFYLTNALGDEEEYPVWRSHLISRAAENQRYIVGVNAVGTAPKCPTICITPKGRVLAELPSTEARIGTVDIDLSAVSNWYVSQSVVSVTDI